MRRDTDTVGCVVAVTFRTKKSMSALAIYHSSRKSYRVNWERSLVREAGYTASGSNRIRKHYVWSAAHATSPFSAMLTNRCRGLKV